MKATFIKKALKYYHGNDFFLCEVKTGPSWGTSMGKIDAWAMAKSWAHPRVVAYEIKVNRNDFLNDNKWVKYLRCCNEFYFVCPKGLIDKGEVPENVGLIYISDKGKARKVVKAKYYKKISEDVFIYIIMNRIESDRYPFHSNRKEYLKDWLKNKDENKNLSWRVKGALIEELDKLTKELEKYKDKARDFDSIQDLLDKSNVDGWSIINKIEKLIEKSKIKTINKEAKLIGLFDKMHDLFEKVIND